ncbi:MAG: hypothetical protein M1826_007523 [Phylliscum demangeonii]|nr:MAG: hypothetical protein M1826_007523 [Phylliscum demangeonii]
MSWKKSEALMDTIKHYSSFPATGVSLRQMVQFGERPSTGQCAEAAPADAPRTLFRASQFLSEELPIRLAHRVQELDHLPDGLSAMTSIQRVKDWYAQSFDELTTLPRPSIDAETKARLLRSARIASASASARASAAVLSRTTKNPSVEPGEYRSSPPPATDGSWSGPHGAGKRPVTTATNRRYYATVEDGEAWPTSLQAYNERFAQLLERIKRRHDGVVTTIAQGMLEWKQQTHRQLHIDPTMQSFLDRFYMSRIGIRMLIGQHIALTEQRSRAGSAQSQSQSPPSPPPHGDYVGIICTRTNVRELAQEAIANAQFICSDHYGLFDAPPVQLICAPELTFMYVPGHLSHMLFELLKNSLRAVVETHPPSDHHALPTTKVIVAAGHEDITIKISDEGGGIARSAIPLVWKYMYTTMSRLPSSSSASSSSSPDDPETDRRRLDTSYLQAPMAGFGYGLPISRLYARYFGGDLKLISMENYGTDAYLHLNRLSSSSEPLQ